MNTIQFLIGRSGLDLQDDFYPDDLPAEWRFGYYSTLFKALLLAIDTDEDLEQIFEEMQDLEDFKLVLSIQQSQLADVKQLALLLNGVADYQQHFTLFCEIDKAPTKATMQLLKGYQLCFQSAKALKLELKKVLVSQQYLFFNQYPVLYTSESWDEKQMSAYLQQASNTNTKTILICRFAESETLNKMRIIAELLGY